MFFIITLSPDYPEAGVPDRHGVTLTSYINRPLSRGEVTLASADPLDRPIINPNYLSIRGEEATPGRSAKSDFEIESFVRRTAFTTWHPSGTCKMGHDELAAVDSHLGVRGMECLRVEYASIMPTIVSGNTNAPTIMIAEKAADLIQCASQ